MSSSFSGASGFEINNSTFYQVNLGSNVYICVCCDPTARPALGVGLRPSDEVGLRVPPPHQQHQQHYPVHGSVTSLWPEIIQLHQRQIIPIHFSSQSDFIPFTQVYPAPMLYTQSYFTPTYQEIVGPLQQPWLQPPHHQVLPFGLSPPTFQNGQMTNEPVQTPHTESSVVPPALCQPLLHRQHAEMTIPLGQHPLHQDYTPPSTRIYPPPSAETYLPPSTEIYPPPPLPPPLYHHPTVDPYAQRFLDEAQRRQLPY